MEKKFYSPLLGVQEETKLAAIDLEGNIMITEKQIRISDAKEVLHHLSILIDSINSSTKKLQDIEAWALRGLEHFKDEPDKRYFFEELLIKIS